MTEETKTAENKNQKTDSGNEKQEPRPDPWVALVKMTDEDSIKRVAESYFGPGRTSTDFLAEFGIDLTEFKNYYIWVGPDIAPQGPVTPGPVRPVVVIRQLDSGQYRPHIFTFPKGFFNNRSNMAWIKSEEWEERVGS